MVKSVTNTLEDGIASKTYFLYDGNNVIMEADEEGVTSKNTYGGPLLLRTEFNGSDETTYEYLYNAHGDVVTLLTDGEVAATYYYDSFGNILDQTGDVSNSILYAGYQYDEETGLYYINARMYDPVTARFLQADTYLGNTNDPLSLNLYTYCLNNPYKYVDPSGHSVLLAFLLVTAVSGLLGAGMEYVSQKYIEKRDVINYDLVLYEGLFNAAVAIASMGMANVGIAAVRQAGRVTVRSVARTMAWGAAFGAVEGAINNVGRQQVLGTSLNNLDYGQVAEAAGFTGLIGGAGAAVGVGLDMLKQSRALRKMANGAEGRVAHYANLLKDSNVDSILRSADMDVPVEGMGRKSGSKTKDIYRAVGVDEYYDIMSTKQFRGIEGKTLAAKEFGNDFSETLDFANRSINRDKVAIFKVTVPEDVYNRLNHMNLDASIFKSGTPVVEPDMLKYFNKNIISFEHFY